MTKEERKRIIKEQWKLYRPFSTQNEDYERMQIASHFLTVDEALMFFDLNDYYTKTIQLILFAVKNELDKNTAKEYKQLIAKNTTEEGLWIRCTKKELFKRTSWWNYALQKRVFRMLQKKGLLKVKYLGDKKIRHIIVVEDVFDDMAIDFILSRFEK